MKSMKVDFVAKTITITAECAERMNDPNSTEYKAIRQLCADFPSMKIVKRTTARLANTFPRAQGKSSTVISSRT